MTCSSFFFLSVRFLHGCETCERSLVPPLKHKWMSSRRGRETMSLSGLYRSRWRLVRCCHTIFSRQTFVLHGMSFSANRFWFTTSKRIHHDPTFARWCRFDHRAFFERIAASLLVLHQNILSRRFHRWTRVDRRIVSSSLRFTLTFTRLRTFFFLFKDETIEMIRWEKIR